MEKVAAFVRVIPVANKQVLQKTVAAAARREAPSDH
jgi:hypothetical protein